MNEADELEALNERIQAITTAAAVTYNNAQQQQQQVKNARKNNTNDTLCHSADAKRTAISVAAINTGDGARVRSTPELNLPEKILLVIDTVKEQRCTPYKLGTGATYSPLLMIKRVVENFVSAKSTIQPGMHEYALMSLDSRDASWLCDYTSNTKTVLSHLESITEDLPEEEQQSYDLGQLFEAIHARIASPARHQPTFVSRVILIYARSNTIPKFHTGPKYLDSLTENPYFFLDVLFVHEPPDDDNMCEAVYAEITALDTTSFSYIFEVGRNAAKIHDNMAKLLAHPLQRPPQRDASYTLYSATSAREVHTNV